MSQTPCWSESSQVFSQIAEQDSRKGLMERWGDAYVSAVDFILERLGPSSLLQL